MDESPFTTFYTKHYTELLTNSWVEGAIYWIYAFPSNNVVSSIIGPKGIVPERSQPDFNRKSKAFGAYIIAYFKTKNYIRSRGGPPIVLWPSNNKVGKYIMSLLMGKLIHSCHWGELPINDEVIMKVEELSEKEKNQLKLMVWKYLSGH